MKKLEDFKFCHLEPYIEAAREMPPVTVAVAGAGAPAVIETLSVMTEQGLARVLLFGDVDCIEELVAERHMNPDSYDIRGVPGNSSAALEAAVAAGSGEADVLMKGTVSSGAFLRAVLSEAAQLRTGRVLSHLGLFDIPQYDRLLGLTDGGINIDPGFFERTEIVRNAARAGHRIWSRPPRIALVAAVEKVQENMPVTIQWAAISKMADRGQLGDAIVDGPLGLDNALDPEALRQKGIESRVRGRADILVVPDIEAGNLVGKSLTYLAGAPMAGLVLGARVPVVLNSRADSPGARIASLIMARLVSGN